MVSEEPVMASIFFVSKRYPGPLTTRYTAEVARTPIQVRN